MTFTATAGGGEKTQIDGYNMKWKGEETIYMHGKLFTTDAGDGAESAEFTGESVELDNDGKYKAYYGVNYNDGTYSLRAEQTYKADGDLSGVNPMYAESDDTNLHFYNICALVKLTVSGASDMRVKNIVASASESLSGAFIVEQSTEDLHYYAEVNEGVNTVTLDCGDGVELGDFYVALPEGEYTELKFTVNYTTGGVDKALDFAAAKNSGENTKLIAGNLYTKDVVLWLRHSGDYDGVQLWENGPYWATCNLGASKPEEYGDYYMWGESPAGRGLPLGLYLSSYPRYTIYNDTPNGNDIKNWGLLSEHKTGFVQAKAPFWSGGTYADGLYVENGELTEDADIARIVWGGDWKMPTQGEFQELYDHCTYSWEQINGVDGCKFKGKVYSDRSVFFPAAGYCFETSRYYATSYGYYWSRSLNSTTPYNAYYLYFNSGSVFPANHYLRYGGRSVRPVL